MAADLGVTLQPEEIIIDIEKVGRVTFFKWIVTGARAPEWFAWVRSRSQSSGHNSPNQPDRPDDQRRDRITNRTQRLIFGGS